MRRGRIADGSVLVGGALLVVSAFLPWVRNGPGHSLHGHRLVDAVVALGNNVPGLSAARLTVLWYVVPALGALTWIVFGVQGRTTRSMRVVAVAALGVTLLTVVAFGRAAGFADLGLGALVSIIGALVIAAGAFLRRA